MDYIRFENETDDEVIFRICQDKDKIGTWQDVADILNQILGFDYGESTYRKKFAVFQKISNNNDMQNIIRELEREKIKVRDERNAWRKQNYIEARAEDKLDKLEEKLSEIGRVIFPDTGKNFMNKGKTTMLIMLEDLHIGASFNSYWGEYNSDIAKERLSILLDEVSKIKDRHNISNCVVTIQGDLISGIQHRSVQVTNRENMVDQIKVAAELISSFCYELSKMFDMVTTINVSGNHSRIDNKKDAIHEDRLDDIVMYCVDILLKNVINFRYATEYNLDTGVALFPICGKYYVAVHGDYDPFSKQGVSNLITMLHAVPYGVLYGHMHSPAIDEYNGIKMIRGGSLCGSGEQFTVEKRLYGTPSQMVCVCNQDGIEAYYPIELKENK